jgi:hypothetical protein
LTVGFHDVGNKHGIGLEGAGAKALCVLAIDQHYGDTHAGRVLSRQHDYRPPTLLPVMGKQRGRTV